jgi:glutathione S-transferase
VPAIAYGGPDVPADKPSPESTKIAESLVLLEFIADLYPEANLLPKDPVQRAQARFFIDVVGNKFLPGWGGFAIRGESPDVLFKGIEEIQNILVDGASYAVGEQYTIADISITPFIARLELALDHDLGASTPGERKEVHKTLTTSPKYAKFWAYYGRIKNRESVKKTTDEVSPFIATSSAPADTCC